MLYLTLALLVALLLVEASEVRFRFGRKSWCRFSRGVSERVQVSKRVQVFYGNHGTRTIHVRDTTLVE